MKKTIIVLFACWLFLPTPVSAEEATFGGFTCSTIRWAAAKFSVEEREKWIADHHLGWKQIARIKKVCKVP